MQTLTRYKTINPIGFVRKNGKRESAVAGTPYGVARGIASALGAGRQIVMASGEAAGYAAAIAASFLDTDTPISFVYGSSAASGQGKAIAAAVGIADGTSAIVCEPKQTIRVVGTAAGSATTFGQKQGSGSSGFATGVATATGQGAPIRRATGTAAGTSVVSGSQQGKASIGLASGLATVSAQGKLIFRATGSAAGVATASAQNITPVTSLGSAAGAATASGQSSSTASSVGSSAGAATASGNPNVFQSGTGASAGVATASGQGIPRTQATGSSAGTTIVSGQGLSDVAFTGSSSGVATAAGAGSSLGGGTINSGNGSSAGVATASAVRPLMATFKVDFDNNTIDQYLWEELQTNEAYVRPEDGVLKIEARNVYQSIASRGSYNLTNGELTVELVSIGPYTAVAGREVEIVIYKDGAENRGYNASGFVILGTYGQSPLSIVDGTVTYHSWTTYAPATHRFMRVRHASGNIYWDRSADGLSWTNIYSLAAPSWIDAVHVQFIAGNYTADETPIAVSQWNNVNKVPKSGNGSAAGVATATGAGSSFINYQTGNGSASGSSVVDGYSATEPTIKQSKVVSNDTLTTSTSATFDTAPANGNLLLAFLAVEKNSTAHSASGWNGPVESHGGGTSIGYAIFWKISDGNNPTETFTWTTANGSGVILVEMNNAHTVTPINASGEDLTNAETNARTTGTISATSTVPNTTAIAFVCNDTYTSLDTSTARTWTNSFTEYYFGGLGTSPALLLASKRLQTPQTASTVYSYSGDSSDQIIGAMVIIAPKQNVSIGVAAGTSTALGTAATDVTYSAVTVTYGGAPVTH